MLPDPRTMPQNLSILSPGAHYNACPCYFLDSTQGGLVEIKHGRSVLNSTYQLRLQTFRSLTEELPYTIRTTRPVNSTFQEWLQRWGVTVEKIE